MIIRRWNGIEYQYFDDSQAIYDDGSVLLERPARAPQPGTLMVGCPACGVKLKKPRPVFFWPDGNPKCIMQNPNQSA